MSDHGTDPEEDRSQFKSSWAVEWKDEEKNTVEIKEENEYPQALTFFNELSGSGKDVVLYELRTPIANPSAQPRKIPVLNSIKAKSRELAEQKPRERESINRTTRSPRATKSSSLKDLRTRIFILIAVIATFVVILLLISVLFTGSDIVHQFLYVSSISYGQLNLACDYACVP